MRPAVIVPALDAAATVAEVVTRLGAELGQGVPIIVVDDGSTDGTADKAREAGAEVLRHVKNLGKGAAIRTGLRRVREMGYDVALTVDADGQHPPSEARRLLIDCTDSGALVLGIRDFDLVGAPPANILANRVSNFFVSIFTWRRFVDTQCGLRRYPVDATLALRTYDQRFGFEAEVLFAASRAKIPIAFVPVTVLYPPKHKRVTKYRAVRDTVHIVLRITYTILHPARWFLAVLVVFTALFVLHPAIAYFTRMSPPPVSLPSAEPRADVSSPDLVYVGSDYARHRGKILEVSLSGTPEEIGTRHVSLLKSEMLANESQLWSKLEQLVPSSLARLLIFDIARLRFRHLDLSMSEPRRREIAAAARAFAPDPWESRIPSYQRMVYLHTLYDVSLSFEHSPLIGCTSFALHTAEGHTLLARNFDFEAGDIFDEHKAVFLVREQGKLAYASVAWPGLIGAVTGINEAGVALVVHGGRASEPTSEGEPLVHTMRDVLGAARTTNEAIVLLGEHKPMVSHLVMLADAQGDRAVVERVPGRAPWVRRESKWLALTNHFEGPAANDRANLEVKRETSTLSRRARLDELLAKMPNGASDVEEAIAVLRDKQGPGEATLPLGDRRAIDAQIATHAVVIDTTAKILWVSEGPHLQGRFVRFDIGRLLAPGYDPRSEHDVVATPSDPSGHVVRSASPER